MISTLERENSIDGMLFGKMKELPNWYGIDNIGFIWHGEWSDPEIEYKGKRINSTVVEDTMWYEYTHDEFDKYIPEKEFDQDGFSEYMLKNKDKVYELIEIAMEADE